MGPILQAIFQTGARRVGFLFLIALVAGYGWIALHGPQGIQALVEKHRTIRELQERNAAMELENQRRRERISRLKDSPSEQDMEIRKQLKMVRPGETTFILPDAPKDDAKPDDPQK